MRNKSFLLRIRALRLQLERELAFDRQSKKMNENHISLAVLFILGAALLAVMIFVTDGVEGRDEE